MGASDKNLMPEEPTMILTHNLSIPVRRRSGKAENIGIADIVSQYDTDPVVRFDWGRSDMDVWSHELLIGIFTAAGFVPKAADWHRLYDAPPSVEQLSEYLSVLDPHFDQDRFMQDMDPLADGSMRPIANLFLGGISQDQLDENSDVMVNRDGLSAIGPDAIAVILYGHHSWASAGGSGYRTSIRGGGPLTVVSASGDTLWQRIFSSVETNHEVAARAVGRMPELSKAFPWNEPHPSNAKTAEIHSDNSHPVLAYFSMPHRIRLIADPAGGKCDLTGRDYPVLYRNFMTRNYGNNYVADTWKHPLTGYYKDKEAWRPILTNTSMLGFRDLIGIAMSASDGTSIEPDVVRRLNSDRVTERSKRITDPKILIAGYNMSNAKALSYLSVEMSILPYRDFDVVDVLNKAVAAQYELVSYLRDAVKDGDALRDKKYRGKSRFVHIDLHAHRVLEGLLDRLMGRIMAAAGADREPLLKSFGKDWLTEAGKLAETILDRELPLDSSETSMLRKRAQARKSFGFFLRGYNPASVRLYKHLDLPLPEKKPVLVFEEVEA
jgi:CRISPR system Cascade subunit CasA